MLRFLLVCPVAILTVPVEGQFDREVRPLLSEHCFRCHGPDPATRKARLRLDTREGLFGVRKNGAPVVPGDPGASVLIRRITSEDPKKRMPPPSTHRTLTEDQVATLVAWIRDGAAWNQHWAFQPPVRPALPPAGPRPWARNPLDRFVLRRLQREGWEPNPPATKRRLLRRVTLDLTGLPPTPEELAAFVADPSTTAYEAVVDRLLASPRYGERMAWEWLEAARYADTNGYQGDATRTMWPYRDWVVDAFNRNLPFDDFLLWQIAGDLLPDATFEQRLATAFCRNHMINGEGGRIPEENRVEYVLDQTDTVGTVGLGLTLTCARCHNHKYDPLSQREYYALSAFFNQTPVTGAGGNPQTKPTLTVRSEADRQKLEQCTAQLRDLEALAQALATPAAQRTAAARARIAASSTAGEPDPKEVQQRIAAARTALDRHRKASGRIKVMVMADQPKKRKTYVLRRGVYRHRGEEVVAGVPGFLGGTLPPGPRNRLALARWLIDPQHPLTSRVAVNRHWARFFGTGLVETVEDFGVQGAKPSHPELLDWLAVEFVRSGWDVKALHRWIVTSATYRQAAATTPARFARDPGNRLLGRGPRFRLPSFVIRDLALAVSGLLVEKRGGPPVRPYQPPGVWADATFGNKRYQEGKGDALYRRSLYTFWRRIVGPTVFFDVARRQTCEVRTPRTNTPMHALLTLNDVTYVEAARAMAQRVLGRGGLDDRGRLAYAFELATSREPGGAEVDILAGRLAALRGEYRGRPAAAKQLLANGASPRDPSIPSEEHAAWTGVCSLILNLDETLNQ